MKRLLKIILTMVLITSFSTIVHADRAEFKKLNRRVALLYKNGKFLEAIEMQKEVIKVAEETFGDNNAYVISSLNNLALIYFQDEQYENAKLTYEQSLVKTENSVGKTNTNIIKILEDIKKCCEKMGNSSEVEELDNRLEILRRSVSG